MRNILVKLGLCSPEEAVPGTLNPPHFTPEIYRDSGQWYWHVRAANKKVIACGGQGFQSKRNAERAASTAYRLIRGE